MLTIRQKVKVSNILTVFIPMVFTALVSAQVYIATCLSQ